MTFWLFGVLSLGAAVGATFLADIRLAALALWLVGLGAGAMFLSMGAELLAVVQWIVSTFVVISFIFYAVLFGEYGFKETRQPRIRWLTAGAALLAGGGVFGVIAFGAREIEGMTGARPLSLVEGEGAMATVAALGRDLAANHLLSLEVLALTLFLVIVGAGVVARPEVQDR